METLAEDMQEDKGALKRARKAIDDLEGGGRVSGVG